MAHIDTKGLCLLCYEKSYTSITNFSSKASVLNTSEKCALSADSNSTCPPNRVTDRKNGFSNCENEGDSTTNKRVNQFCKTLFRILNVNMKKYRLGCVFQPSDGISKIAQIQICSNCFKIADNICTIYQKISLLQLKLEWELRRIRDNMKAADKIPLRSSEFYKSFKPVKQTSLTRDSTQRHQELADVQELRRDIIRKCSKKLHAALPKLTVRKITPSSVVTDGLDKLFQEEKKQKDQGFDESESHSPLLDSYSLQNSKSPQQFMEIETDNSLGSPPPSPRSESIRDLKQDTLPADESHPSNIRDDTYTIPQDSCEQLEAKYDPKLFNKFARTGDSVSIISGTSSYDCKICSRTFSTRKAFKLHSIEHETKSFRSFTFSKHEKTNSNLQHTDKNNDENQLKAQCESGTSVKKHKLHGHTKKRSIKRPKSLINNVEGDKLAEIETTGDIHRAHSIRSMYKCTVCSKSFSSRERLQLHDNEHPHGGESRSEKADSTAVNKSTNDVAACAVANNADVIVKLETAQEQDDLHGSEIIGTSVSVMSRAFAHTQHDHKEPKAEAEELAHGITEMKLMKPKDEISDGDEDFNMAEAVVDSSNESDYDDSKDTRHDAGRQKRSQNSRKRKNSKFSEPLRDASHCKSLKKIMKARRNERQAPRDAVGLPENTCEVCKSQLGSKAELEKHRVVVHNIFLYIQCEKCREWFPDHYNYSRHVERTRKCMPKNPEKLIPGATPIFPYSFRTQGNLFCPKSNCFEVFNTDENLKLHLSAHGSFTCKFCEKLFEKAHELAMHEFGEHSLKSANKEQSNIHESTKEKETSSKNLEGYECVRCKYSIGVRRIYVQHFLSKHLKISSIGETCPVCNYGFFVGARKSVIQRHMKMHEVEGNNGSETATVFKCSECSAPFKSDPLLTQHLRREHNIAKSYKCCHCEKTFPAKKQMKAHIERLHNSKEDHSRMPHQCTVCGKGFQSKFSYECHSRQHKVGVHFQCQLCDRTFSREVDFKTHMKAHERKANPSQSKKCEFCDLCGKQFKDKVKLRQHVQVVHEGPEKWTFVCANCGKKCMTQQKLDEHSRTHTKEKPFICHTCGKSYGHRHNLRNHMKSTHGTESTSSGLLTKPYVKPFDSGIKQTQTGDKSDDVMSTTNKDDDP